MHRDVKPENVFVDDAGRVKLIDFGLADFSGLSSQFVGTSYYLAPEVIEGCYDERCDNWSLGGLTYVLLTGLLPFGGDTTEEIIHRIETRRVTFPAHKPISDTAMDFIERLLTKDPQRRMKAHEALKHVFIALPSKDPPTEPDQEKERVQNKNIINDHVEKPEKRLSPCNEIVEKLLESHEGPDGEDTSVLSEGIANSA